jgi:hypothetical protein
MNCWPIQKWQLMPTKCGAALMATERYHPLFASDLAAACSYYDAIADTLGNRFRWNVRSIIQTVVERPESFGRVGGDFRGALVHRFPTWLSSLAMAAF